MPPPPNQSAIDGVKEPSARLGLLARYLMQGNSSRGPPWFMVDHWTAHPVKNFSLVYLMSRGFILMSRGFLFEYRSRPNNNVGPSNDFSSRGARHLALHRPFRTETPSLLDRP